ncbi:MAG: efflux RND transporter permease subunit, partial [Bacteroidales bacterium]|nr:efflux RND transporter permease subunit [Bacteroidales bacterium]
SLIGVLIPIMMIAIANNYGVYFIARYQDLNAAEPDLSVNALVTKTTAYLVKPVALCGLTTIVGVLGLAAHLLIPARQMGVVTALGITFALLCSLLFIPAVMSLLKKGNARKTLSNGTNGFFTSVLTRTAHRITERPRMVIIVFMLFMGLSAAGLLFLRIAPDSNKVLPEKHAFNKAISIADTHFGGSKVIYAMYDGDVTDPGLLNSLDRYEQELKMLPNVGTVTSLATIVRKISKALNDSTESGYDAIPPSQQAIAQYLELYSMSGDPADLEQYVSFDYTKTLMTIQYQADNLAQVRQIPDMLHRLSQKDSLTPVIGGPSLTDKDISESVEHGQYYSLLAAFVAILILLSLIFKSIYAGMLGSLPLVFAVLCTFGLMGWLGIELNIVTALLSSISIGLGVDFTIHVLWRIKWELASGNDYAGSITSTLKTIGRGIIINACSVMLGFAVLFLSAFPLIRSFAFLIIVSLFLCLVSGLVLVPAFCYLFRPEFLNKPIKNTYE